MKHIIDAMFWKIYVEAYNEPVLGKLCLNKYENDR